MSVQAMSWVIEKSQHKGSSFVVLLMIANHAHSDGTHSHPSFECLARESRITVRQVTNIIPILERSRELGVQHGAGPEGTNLYTLRINQASLPMEKISIGKRRPRISSEPKTLIQNIKEREEEPLSAVATLPVWVPRQEWNEFVEMRKRMRAPLTEAAKKRTLDDLWKLNQVGQSVGAVLAQSVQRSWRGVFEVRNGGGNGQTESSQERRSRTSTTAVREVAEYLEGVAPDVRRALPPTDK